MGQTVAAYSGPDGNGDGLIDQTDYEFWRSRFGYSFSARASAADVSQQVPEAATGVLISLVPLLFCGRQDTRRRSCCNCINSREATTRRHALTNRTDF
jgi:hypothetical protein